MGCAQSRIDNEESVSRCKERRILMKEALLARSAFVVGHSAYAIALKNAGSALSDYGHGEAPLDPDTIAVSAPPPVSVPEPPPPPPLPPPPPPLPTFSPSPLQRSVTMPEFSVSKRSVSRMESLNEPEEDEEEGKKGKERERERHGHEEGGGSNEKFGVRNEESSIKGMAWDYFFMSENMHGSGLGEIDEEIEEEDDDDDEDDEDEDDHHDHALHQDHEGHLRRRHNNNGGHNEEVEFKTPEKAGTSKVAMGMETPPHSGVDIRHFVHSNTAPPDVGRVSNKMEDGDGITNNVGGGGGNKVNLMKVLEAIDDDFLKASECAQEVTKLLEAHKFQYHSTHDDNRVPVDHAARVMRVITWNKALNNMSQGGRDEYEDNETLATVLDKLMAWEKKLYEEVKAGEMMKLEYQRKVGLLNKQKKRGASTESVEKTKAAVSHLHTRYIVDMQSMDSTVAEVNELRDQQLFPKLVELVDGLGKMWENICIHHDNQLQVATELKSFDIMLAPRETTRPHHKCTLQLSDVVQHWLEQFDNMVIQQKQYVRCLHSWLKLNLIPIESNLKEKVSSPPRAKNPPIQSLLHAWHDALEKLPDEVTKTAISSFGAVIKTIILHQEEEMRLKHACEEIRKEYMRKKQSFDEWSNRYSTRKGLEVMDPDRGEDGTAKDPVSERQVVVATLKKRLDDELERHQRHCVQVREKSLGTLKTRLPELFRSLSEYAHASCDSYTRLRAIALSQSFNGVSS